MKRTQHFVSRSPASRPNHTNKRRKATVVGRVYVRLLSPTDRTFLSLLPRQQAQLALPHIIPPRGPHRRINHTSYVLGRCIHPVIIIVPCILPTSIWTSPISVYSTRCQMRWVQKRLSSHMMHLLRMLCSSCRRCSCRRTKDKLSSHVTPRTLGQTPTPSMISHTRQVMILHTRQVLSNGRQTLLPSGLRANMASSFCQVYSLAMIYCRQMTQ